MASRWRAGEVLTRRRRLPCPAWVMSERPQRRQGRQRSFCRTLGSHIWKHLIWAELLSLSTGWHTDTPRCGQGTNKRTLSYPSCKYLTPHLTIQSRTSLILKLSQQHCFSLRRSLTPSSCWLKAAVSDSLHLYGVGLFSVPLSCSVCTSHICRGPRCWQPAPSLCSSGRHTLITDCCSNVLQCKVFSSRLATFAKLNESDVTPPPATNYSWKMGKFTHLVTILSGEN